MMELEYLSKADGIGGSLKSQPEDFIVEEITEDGDVLELDKPVKKNEEPGKFTHFVLQKKDWSTADAIAQIARSLGISHSRFNFAGTKDKRAVTTQLVSVLGISPERMLSLKIKDIYINGAWTAKDKVSLGALLGNRFKIRVDGAKCDREHVDIIYEDLEGKFPNYFGEQRFGSTRKNTHVVGEKLIRGDLESAVMEYLANSEGEEHEEARLARRELSDTQDFKSALKTFPKHLRMERSMLAHLAENPEDFSGALKKLPRNILLLFIHAFQSHMFNELLSQRIKEAAFKPEEGEYLCAENDFGFPDLEKRDGHWLVMKLIGYETFDLSDREYDVLEKHNITPKSFRIKELPEISSKGSYRTAFAPLKEFAFKDCIFRFSIPSGSYATIALREFIDLKNK
jgi:tRNA pseudouridine13 synthase